MTNEIEYIEPTQEHVGQMVEVRDKEGACWRTAKLTAIIECDSDNSRFVAKKRGDCYSMSWQFARIARPLTYAERQAKCELKVGDRVKFVRAWNDGESDGTTDFLQGMQRHIGKSGRITSMSKSSCCVHFDESGYWYFPCFVLEKVDDRVATRDDIGKQVYVDGTPSDVFTIETIYGVEGDLWRAVVRSGDKRFVYELSNLRVKE